MVSAGAEGPGGCRAGARSRPRRPRAAARGRAGSSPAARAAPGDWGSLRGTGSAGRPSRGDGGAWSPPSFVAFEKPLCALLRDAQRRGPLVEQLPAAVGGRIRALAVAPRRGDEAFLLEGPQQAVEVPHLDARLAGELGEPLEQVVAVRRPLAQEQEQSRLGEALDAREHVPTTAGVPPGSRAAPHRASTCKTHMYVTIAGGGGPRQGGYSRLSARDEGFHAPAVRSLRAIAP